MIAGTLLFTLVLFPLCVACAVKWAASHPTLNDEDYRQ
jgi:hypothetical protein